MNHCTSLMNSTCLAFSTVFTDFLVVVSPALILSTLILIDEHGTINLCDIMLVTTITAIALTSSA